jgi:hypothetical protein
MISSTIYDFRDIRKRLKKVLKDSDYDVIISEDGDIQVNSEETIYINCLDAVEQSDIVITLIGKRYGSLYNKSEEISITRKEYRHAKQNNIKRLIFIDRTVWNARKIYQKYLQDEIEFKVSSIVNDKKILDFIDEVCENDDWVFQFDNINDLEELVKKQLHIVDPQYELFFQPLKGNPRNKDGTFNCEIGFKNISDKPLMEFRINIDFNKPVISVNYDPKRSSVNFTGGKYLHNNKTSYDWVGQILPSKGWIVFIIQSVEEPVISRIKTNYSGKIHSTGDLIAGTPFRN